MSKQWHGGKGSQQRKSDKQAYSDGWDAIFGKNKETKTVSETMQDELEPIHHEGDKKDLKKYVDKSI